MRMFWTLRLLCVTTIALVRAGKAEKCDPSAPARGIRTPRGLRVDPNPAPAHLPLEYFTRLFLEHSVLLPRFFSSAPARRTWGRRTDWPAATSADPRDPSLSGSTTLRRSWSGSFGPWIDDNALVLDPASAMRGHACARSGRKSRKVQSERARARNPHPPWTPGVWISGPSPPAPRILY